MRIAEAQITPFEARFKGDGFAVSYGRLTHLRHRLLRLVAEDGSEGWGEIERKPATDEDAAETEEDRLMPALAGRTLAEVPTLAAKARAPEHGWPGCAVALALEMAWLDLIGRRTGLSVSALLGGPAEGAVPALLGLSCETPESIAEQITERGQGFANVQIKLGTGAIAEDLVRIEAALGALRPGQHLFADFNGILPRELALSALAAVTDPRLTWEEPCRTLDDNLACAAALTRPVLLDQCIADLPTLMRAIGAGLPQGVTGISIKPFYLGGLSVARTARDLATAMGVPMRIDGPWCGPLAAAASVHLALGVPEDLLLFSANLTDPLEASPSMLDASQPGRVATLPGSGLGPIPAALTGSRP